MYSYQSFIVNQEDDLETRRKKLYLGIISLGEQLYSMGAAVAEQQKKFNQLDKVLAEMRAEFNKLKESI